MNIDLDDIVKNVDIEKLIEDDVRSKVVEYLDVECMIDEALEDEKLQTFVRERVKNILDVYLSSEDGKMCIIEQFKEAITNSDVFIDDRITDIIVELLKKSLIGKY